MTPDLLAALRETPGCGQDPDCTWPHDRAVEQANECDPCLTRLAEAVLKQVVAREPAIQGDIPIDDPETEETSWISRDRLLASLLATLRSETPR